MDRSWYVICDNIRSLYNVGSIFRTSDALGVTKVYLCGITGTPAQAGLLKVSLGAEKSVPWEYVSQTWRLVDRLKHDGLRIVALEQGSGSVDLRSYRPEWPMALVLGNEVTGVSPAVLKRCDDLLEIDMRGAKESLNVVVAFGIAGYQLVNK